MNILLVEDNPVTLEAIESILGMHGMTAQHAETGDGAMAWMGVQAFDAIVLDLYLTTGDGLALLRRLRGDPRFANIPVVITTAAAEEDVDRVCAELPALAPVALLRKPYEPDELLDLLKSAESFALPGG